MLKQLHLAGLLSWLQIHVPDKYFRAGYARLQAGLDPEKEGESPRTPLLRPEVAQFLAKASTWLAVLTGRLGVLVPSFLQRSRRPTRSPHPSAWLDGLRGISAFLIVWHHASLLWFPWHIHNGFGSTAEDRLLIQWPFIRLCISGLPQVMVFFVVSGYAISYRPLKLAHQGRFAEFNDALCSSVFRRHPRLFLPAVATTFCTALMAYLGLFGTQGWGDVAVPTRSPHRPGNFTGQMADWAHHTVRMVDPVSRDMHRALFNGYDPNLWTLPVEFDCSMFVFLCIAAFSRLRPRARLLLTLGVVVFANHYTYWRIFLFSSGMLLCDLHFYLDPPTTPPAPLLPEHSPAPESLSRPAPADPQASQLRQTVTNTSVVLALFVLSIPEAGRGGEITPGYATLFGLLPANYAKLKDHFWVPLGAVWLLFTLDRAPHLQRWLARPVPQYLGKISYSLYLVHGPLLWSLGRAAAVTFVGRTGRETGEMYCFGIFLSAVVFWAVAICVADLVWRFVDTKAVEVGRVAYAWLTRRDGEGTGTVQL